MESPTTHSLRYVAPGDLVSTQADPARAALMSLAEQGPASTPLEIDLRAARLIDSVGLNLLVGAIKARRKHGGTVHILVAHPAVQRVLAFTRIDQHARVVTSEPTAP